jgi:peptidoglycan/xylan/chitin deacetylase (PgdA/CDA1 family)
VGPRSALPLAVLAAALLLLSSCALLRPVAPPPPVASPPVASPPVEPARADVFESEDFVVTFASPGDTAESLALRFLGDAGKAWMIQDYNGTARLLPGQEVVIPRREWNPAGVDPTGYQLVPVLVYHQIADDQRGRVVVSTRTFEEQMRYLRARGFRVVTLAALVDFFARGRQLPRNAVVLTFDDGYRSFLEHAYPVLRELGFPATLFVYTDYVGAGRQAMDWADLVRLAGEGFDVQAHSKTHGDLRRRRTESEADYAKRMQAELGDPQALFERHLGRRARLFAYPYGYHDDELVAKVREYGYEAAFTVRREGNAVFLSPWRLHRSQVYGDMTLEEFARALTFFGVEALR